ncbi:transposase [Streptomyces sp. NBC_00015]|uniref:transposase n=1 Tax=Streptomyces sp. NBC_00015 TaxID=2903611 RepID=UPI00386DF868
MGLERPRCRPDHVIADKAYNPRGFRAYLRRRDVGHTIPEKNDQKQHRRNRGRRGGRPAGFDLEIYRRRNTVERCFNQLKGFRGIATLQRAFSCGGVNEAVGEYGERVQARHPGHAGELAVHVDARLTLPATSVGCPTEETGSAVSPQATATTGAEP